MADPPSLHGPYWSWTRKVNAKTVTRYVPEGQMADYQAFFDNAKHLARSRGRARIPQPGHRRG